MKANEYLEKLGGALGPMEAAERNDFLAEMASHIEDLVARHPDSGEEELVASLTPPERLAEELLLAEGCAPGSGASPRPEAGSARRSAPRPDSGRSGIGSGQDGERGESQPRDRLRAVLESLAARGSGYHNYDEISQDFPADGIEGIRVELISGDFAAESGALDSIRLRARGEGCAERLDFGVEGGFLVVKEKALPRTELDSLELALPDGLASLVVVTRSGDVELKALDLALSVKTASGDVSLRDSRGASVIETASGDVEIEDCGSASVKTASGDVEARGVDGDLVVKTASGDLRIEDVSGRLGLESASGDVELEGSLGPFAVKTSSGGTRASLEGPFAGGLVASVSGDIELEFGHEPDATVDIATRSGDVSVAGRGGRSGRFELGAGGLELKLASVSGDISLGW